MGRQKSELHNSFRTLYLMELSEAAQRRDWMGRVEAVIFAARSPVPREALAQLANADSNPREIRRGSPKSRAIRKIFSLSGSP